MVAASARAWVRFTSSGTSSRSSGLKMFMAPITSVRSRSGSACTIWNPASIACGVNRGQRS